MPPVSDPIAVVDLGTNSTRLLVAQVRDGRVEELERRSQVTRLGERVDATGRLADGAMERVYATLGEYRELIDRHGADQVVAVATSAVRDSENGEDFRRVLRERFGIDARTISGDEEARLTFLGATAARAGETGRTLVIDIGGGSTEFVIGTPGDAPGFHVSTQAGSVRQTERHLHGDPPKPDELDALRQEVRGLIERSVPDDLRAGVERGIAVAGTATQLAAVDQALEDAHDDAEAVEGHRLTREAIARMLGLLASQPLADRRAVQGLDPDRAPTIVAGAAILLEAVETFGLGAVEVARADILHGATLAASGTRNG
jgi:exopolyphosphatase/guanosine-5'-triphosphate,3'-diphosphate pyrophosphatase